MVQTLATLEVIMLKQDQSGDKSIQNTVLVKSYLWPHLVFDTLGFQISVNLEY